MKQYRYFQNKPAGETKRANYSITLNDAKELLRRIALKDPENEELDPDECVVVYFDPFSNGALVVIEAEEWIIDGVKRRPEVRER